MGIAHIVVGLGLGDEGKGSIIDLLCHATCARADVRYSAGPQASHHVVRDDGVVHGFSQLGAGSFHDEVRTHLSRGMVIKASNLLVEIDVLQKKGVAVTGRLTVDPETALVLPWHAMISRMAEEVRGQNRHGSVGMGAGIAWTEREEFPADVLRVRDLFERSLLEQKLSSSYERAQRAAARILACEDSASAARAIHREYTERFPVCVIRGDLQASAKRFAGMLAADEAFYNTVAERSDSIVLEGTHGILLDPKYGFAPHTTDCEVCFEPAERFLMRAAHTDPVKRVGVLRAYASRHGAGPLVTFDERLTRALPEYHNQDTPWQGSARAGDFDVVAARYALECCGGVDFISLTNIDRLRSHDTVSVCTAYEYQGSDQPDLERFFYCKGSLLVGIRPSPREDVCHRTELTRILYGCRPATFQVFPGWRYSLTPDSRLMLPSGLRAWIDFLESDQGLSVPIGILSFGPTRSEKLWLLDS